MNSLFQSIFSILIVLILIAGMDYILIYFFKNFAFTPPSWTGIIPLGELTFLGVSLFLFAMFVAFASKLILKPFHPPKFALIVVGIICLLNFAYLIRELWVISPAFSFWTIVSFIMCSSVISGLNIIYVGFLGSKDNT